MGKLTISMASFNSKLLNYQRVVHLQYSSSELPELSHGPPPNPTCSRRSKRRPLCEFSFFTASKRRTEWRWWIFLSWYQKPVSQVLTHAAFLAQKYKPCLSRAGDDCGNMQWGLFFSKCRRILGMAMPSFWSRNAAYFGPCRDWDPVFKKTTAWCLNAAQKDSPKQLLEFLISPGLKVILGHCLGVEAFWPRIVDFYGMTSLIRGSEVKTSGTTTMQCDTSTSSIIC